MEQRLVRAMSKKKSKRNKRRRRRFSAADAQASASDYHDSVQSTPRRRRRDRSPRTWRPRQLFRRLWQSKNKQEVDRRIRRRRRGYDESSSSSEEEKVSRSSTPRYILDKAGIFRWPPIKLEDSGGQIIKKVGRSFFAIKYQKVSNPDV